MVSGFKEIQRMTSNYHNVFYEKKHICNKGRARYQLELAPVKKFPVSQEFASAVCLLPTRYDSRVYFNFIEKWGTVSSCFDQDDIRSWRTICPTEMQRLSQFDAVTVVLFLVFF